MSKKAILQAFLLINLPPTFSPSGSRVAHEGFNLGTGSELRSRKVGKDRKEAVKLASLPSFPPSLLLAHGSKLKTREQGAGRWTRSN